MDLKNIKTMDDASLYRYAEGYEANPEWDRLLLSKQLWQEADEFMKLSASHYQLKKEAHRELSRRQKAQEKSA